MKIRKKFALITVVALLAIAAATLLVGCGKKPVTIKFETNGGSAVSSITVEKEGTFDLPTTTKEGYAFEGWYSSSNFAGKAAAGKATAHGDATYYAKWSKLYALTLDAAGGSVTPGTFSLKQGESVYDKIKDVAPVYAHHEFAGWYNGGAAVASDLTMPAAALTLTARYAVEYKIEIYLQERLGADEYRKSEEVIGYEKAGENFTAVYEAEGYHEVIKANTRDGGVIAEDYTANVFRLYFDLTTYEITFHSNYPAETGKEEETKVETYVSGKIPAPYGDYSASGYAFAGWAESASGEAAYKVDCIKANAVNADEEATADQITVNKSCDLYAVWVKGYYNLFGGEDIIYYPDKSSQNIYLERGGLYFKGTYLPKANSFFFMDKKGDVMLEGKFTDEEGNDVTERTLAGSGAAFAYVNYARDNSAYNLYTVVGGVNDRIQIIFDEYNGITYSVRGQVPSKGIYYVDKDGYYVVNFYSGNLDGTTMILMISDAEDVRTFRVRNEDEVAFGVMSRGVVVRGELKHYDASESYGLKMDGFGNAVFYNDGAEVALTYSGTENENEYNVLQNDVAAGVIRVFKDGDDYCYMFYEQAFDHEYKINDNSSLSLDGVNTLVFNDSGREITAYYSLGSSVFGNTVTFYDRGDKYVFIIKAVTGSGEFVGDQTQTEVTYVAESRENNYAEYFFLDGASIYYAPLLVFNGTSRSGTHAEVWTRTSSGN
ncbi:MAG: InlB B-repeat-containing protein, partial [Clostridia bacterium]|nr:InlB B-repeat-containing protein [Clostridia bacterium]